MKPAETASLQPDAPASPETDPAAWRAALLGHPGRLLAMAVGAAWLLMWLVNGAHDALNHPEPHTAAARARLLAAAAWTLVVCIGLGALLGRRIVWLLPAVALGALVFRGLYGRGFHSHGLSPSADLHWEMLVAGLLQLVVAGLVMLGMFLAHRPRAWASWVPLALLATWFGAFAVYGPGLILNLDQQAETIRTEWTYEHADPPAAFWAVATAVLAAVAWVRRRR